MKLRALHIERYRAIRALDLSFVSPLGRVRPVTVLAGPNGSGKTSILFAIVQALRDVIGYRTDDVPPPDDFDVHRLGGNQSELHAQPASAWLQASLEFSLEERAAVQAFHEARKTSPNIANTLPELPAGRVEIHWHYPPYLDDPEDPLRYIHALEPGEAQRWLLVRRKALRGDRPELDLPRTGLFGELFMFPQDRLLSRQVSGDRADSREEAGMQRWGEGHWGGPAQRSRRAPNSVLEILKYLSAYTTQRDRPLRDSENPELRIRQQLLALCPPIEYLGYRYLDDDPIGAPYFRNGPTGAPYRLTKAAAGLQVILEYLVRLTYPRPLNHSLILIDEPEVHLHPGWVRRLYLALPQLGEGNQFILSTHSAELRAMAAEDGALIDLGDLEHGAESMAEKPRSAGAAHAEADDPLVVED